MPEKLDKKRILQALADRLPENLLQELFPESSPQDIRELLRKPSNSARPETCKSSTSPSIDQQQPRQSSLPFAEEGKDPCTLYTDGASRGNPGDAGAGIILFDCKGNELLSRSIYLGKCTNNSAEYQALIAGLARAHEAGCRTLNIFLDSELIVRQVQGIYKVKNEQLKPLHDQVKNLLAKFRSWGIRHIPREKNYRADDLANKGIDDELVLSRKD